jgi:site-specific recombinase XerD
LRYVPMTERLAATLHQHRHLQSPCVLCLDDGSSLTRQQVQCRVKRAAKQVGMTQGVHILRHTFCSRQCGARRCGRFRHSRAISNCRRPCAICT